MKTLLSIMSNLKYDSQQDPTRFPIIGPTYRRQMVKPRNETPHLQSVAKPWNTQNILLLDCLKASYKFKLIVPLAGFECWSLTNISS